MMIIVEDGTGLPDSNAYISVEFADSYFQMRGIVSWFDNNEDEKEFAIINATDYIDTRWSKRFKGERLTETQGLEFPRTLWEGIPKNLQRACAEYSLVATIGELWPAIESDSSGFAVSEVSKKVGPIEKTTKYAVDSNNPFAGRSNYLPFPRADQLMDMFLIGILNGRVIRA